LKTLQTANEAEEKISTLNALAAMGEEAGAAAGMAVARAILSKDQAVAVAAKRAFARIDPEVHGACDVILSDADYEIRAAAYFALGRMERRGRSAAPILIWMAQNRSAPADSSMISDGAFAADVLVRIAPDLGTLPELYIAWTKKRDYRIRMMACKGLAKLENVNPAQMEKIVQTLVTTLQDARTEVRSSAAMALGVLGKNAEAAVRGLEKAAADPDEAVRESASTALKKIRAGL
jgi:HEAT repeat protein